MKPKIKWIKGGFTLIEVIITVVVLAVLAAMMASYYDQSFTHSSAPLAGLNNSLRLDLVMEKISVRYAQIPHWRPRTTYAAGTIILPTEGLGIRNGYQYTASSGGTSGATQLVWPIPTPLNPTPNVADGGVTWTLNTAACAPPLQSNTCLAVDGCTFTCPVGLMDLIGTEGNDFTDTTNFCTTGNPCSYRVISNHFIYFDSSDQNKEKPCTSLVTCPNDFPRYLKVTIGFRSDDPNRTGETLTTLFVLR